MKKAITIKQTRDLIEIDAHYFHHFTATADPDLAKLLQFMKTYISAGDELLPDLSLSVTLDKNILVKNLTITKLDVHKCTSYILTDAFDIVAVLAITALKRIKKSFKTNEEISIGQAIDEKINYCMNLKSILLKEHNISNDLQQEVVEIT